MLTPTPPIPIRMLRCLAVFLVLFTGIHAVSAQPEPGVVQTLAPRVHDLDRRLAVLRPDDPEAYFLLGEEVAAEAATRDEQRLAEQLYARAFLYSESDPALAALRASVVLAIAAIEPRERTRRWLLAIARSEMPRYQRPDWSRAVETEVSIDAGADAATAIGAVRSGDGVLARRLLEDEEVRRLIRVYGGLMTGTAGEDALPLVEAEAHRWPCPECRNKRISSSRGEEPVDRLCLTCRGNPGWRLTREQLTGTLRLESFLLRGVQRSWAAQFAADEGAPLRDPDPGQLAAIYSVEPEHPYWRSGGWAAEDE